MILSTLPHNPQLDKDAQSVYTGKNKKVSPRLNNRGCLFSEHHFRDFLIMVTFSG